MTTKIRPRSDNYSTEDLTAAKLDAQRMRAGGSTLQDIGDKYKRSREWARQLLDVHGEIAPWREALAENREAQIAAMNKWLEDNGPVTRSEFAAEFGMTDAQINVRVREGLETWRMIIESNARHDSYTDERTVDALRRAWELEKNLNPTAIGLSGSRYDKLRRQGDPSLQLLVARVGWEVACEAAGLNTAAVNGGRPKETYVSAWTDREILDRVGAFVEECVEAEVRPTYLRYDAWQREDSDRPSGATVRNRMRKAVGVASWPEIVKKSMKD